MLLKVVLFIQVYKNCPYCKWYKPLKISVLFLFPAYSIFFVLLQSKDNNQSSEFTENRIFYIPQNTNEKIRSSFSLFEMQFLLEGVIKSISFYFRLRFGKRRSFFCLFLASWDSCQINIRNDKTIPILIQIPKFRNMVTFPFNLHFILFKLLKRRPQGLLLHNRILQ